MQIFSGMPLRGPSPQPWFPPDHFVAPVRLPPVILTERPGEFKTLSFFPPSHVSISSPHLRTPCTSAGSLRFASRKPTFPLVPPPSSASQTSSCINHHFSLLFTFSRDEFSPVYRDGPALYPDCGASPVRNILSCARCCGPAGLLDRILYFQNPPAANRIGDLAQLRLVCVMEPVLGCLL